MRIPGIPYVQGVNNYADNDGLHYGIAIHNTSNTASDENEASYADHRTDGVSSHFYVDGDSVIQSLDTDRKAGHAGSSNGNNNAIAFELTGTNDRSRQWWLENIAWERLGYVIAYLIQHDPDYAGFQVRRASVAEMKANPKVKAFYGHDDMRLAWGGTTHTDPGGNFAWDRLLQAVNDNLNGGDDDMFSDADRASLTDVRTTLGSFIQFLDKTVPQSDGKAYPIGPNVAVKQLAAAAAADETRDNATLAAVRALTVATGNDPQPILDAIAAAAADTHALVTQLQQQLAVVQTRALKQAQALAAAGVAFEQADD